MEVKKERLAILQNRLQQQALQIGERMVGTTQTILVTSVSKKRSHEMNGRTENNRAVNFKTASGQFEPDLIGKLISVRITEVKPNSLAGTLLE